MQVLETLQVQPSETQESGNLGTLLLTGEIRSCSFKSRLGEKSRVYAGSRVLGRLHDY